jgi:hypothetical protein
MNPSGGGGSRVSRQAETDNDVIAAATVISDFMEASVAQTFVPVDNGKSHYRRDVRVS